MRRLLIPLLAAAALAALAAGAWFARPQQSAADGTRTPVATVAGVAIYEDELLPEIERRLIRLRREEYDIKSRALEELIEEKLLAAEAARRGVSVEELLEAEAYTGIAPPTDEEVAAFYEARKGQINRPLEEIREPLRQALHRARREQGRSRLIQRLRDEAEVVVLLRPPRVTVAVDPARRRGPADAPVMIVEFSDYQCPYCRRAQDTLRQVMAKYPGRVAHAFRDFPLDEIHPRARAAAEAARCAGEQGKFWEYHTRLFERFGQLDRATLEAHAAELGLEAEKFKACLDTGKYRDAIQHDLEEGQRLGVEGTPAFFVNGILLSGAQPLEEFEKIISAELAAKP